ncbi:MAG: N-acetyltransferase [Eubacteriales bacterium]|nr:N-acetyltransferase [Eubacteriales bacterium]MDD3882527.1 N-acetyltransferase [Eubacteriales bacterium]MDD4512827.1 N-acetyltransferase [Eubacteriales bacterium]
MAELKIRLAKTEDMGAIDAIYESARAFMRKSGNPTQWGETHPPRATLIEDIPARRLFVIEGENGVCGVFAFILGEDSTYLHIENGAWKNDEPYGVIHRIAGDGKTHGVLEAALRFASGIVRNIRIDTHENNLVMRRKLAEFGFKYCGIIHVADGTPRLAYQYTAGTPSRAELLSSVAPCSLSRMTCPSCGGGEIGAEAYYAEKKQVPYYLSYKKSDCGKEGK